MRRLATSNLYVKPGSNTLHDTALITTLSSMAHGMTRRIAVLPATEPLT